MDWVLTCNPKQCQLRLVRQNKDVINYITVFGVYDKVRQFYKTAFKGVGKRSVGRQYLEESNEYLS